MWVNLQLPFLCLDGGWRWRWRSRGNERESISRGGGMKTKKEHWRGGGGGVQAMLDLQGWPQQLILCVSFG